MSSLSNWYFEKCETQYQKTETRGGGIATYARFFRDLSYRHWILGSLMQGALPSTALFVFGYVASRGHLEVWMYVMLVLLFVFYATASLPYNRWRVRNHKQ